MVERPVFFKRPPPWNEQTHLFIQSMRLYHRLNFNSHGTANLTIIKEIILTRSIVTLYHYVPIKVG